ncbi:hypothetical protein ACFQGE_16615 [Halomicroarcula sp. GCM10025817]|uniref:hypothetical protein n=1 Tax=Haloarcula TaxID=2237 RepID=UPI0023E81B2D|nr:hypothetical protein [Halomicroarcula sp. SYNS111]
MTAIGTLGMIVGWAVFGTLSQMAIGTMVLLGIAFVPVSAGMQAVFLSISPETVAIEVGVVAVGVYLAAATLGFSLRLESGSASAGIRRHALLATGGASMATLLGVSLNGAP